MRYNPALRLEGKILSCWIPGAEHSAEAVCVPGGAVHYAVRSDPEAARELLKLARTTWNASGGCCEPRSHGGALGVAAYRAEEPESTPEPVKKGGEEE